MKKTIKLSEVKKLIQQQLKEKTGIKKNLSVPEKHQLKIARDTLKMSDAGAMVMGGMSKAEAREFLRKIGYSDTRIKKMEEGNRNMRKRSLREGNSSTMWTAFKKLQDRLHSSEFSLRALLSQGKIDDTTFNKLMKKLSSAIEDIEKTAKV